MMQIQQQTISPLGCLALLILLIVLLPVVFAVVVAFAIYVLVCRLLGVKRRPMPWQNYYRNMRSGASGAGTGGETARKPRPEASYSATPRPASEDIIDVVAVEIVEETKSTSAEIDMKK